ncbi:MAG: HNH endonuclease [Ilumatobacter sp.]|nr:MAG: HNH endonuclease [Ilumatobacter sp.]
MAGDVTLAVAHPSFSLRSMVRTMVRSGVTAGGPRPRPRFGAIVMVWVVVLAGCGMLADEEVEPDRAEGARVLLGLLEFLEVEEEPPREGYQRDLFPHWSDISGSGCTARQDALLAQAIGLVQRDLVRPCVIVEGDWYSPFDGSTYSGPPAEIDVDHVVALAEAWDSGARDWTTARREQFANDPLNLLVTDRQTNRDKADLDAGEWKPDRGDAWCVTASMMILTKLRYEMTIDRAEYDGLREMARRCERPDQRTVPGVPLPGTPEFLGTARAVLDERGLDLG